MLAPGLRGASPPHIGTRVHRGIPASDRNRLTLPAPATELVEVALDLPEGTDAAALPTEVAISNSVGSLTRTVRRDGRKVTVRTEFALTVPVVEPERYTDLRALFTALQSEGARTVVLRRKE